MSYRVDGYNLQTNEKFSQIIYGHTLSIVESMFKPDFLIVWGIIPA